MWKIRESQLAIKNVNEWCSLLFIHIQHATYTVHLKSIVEKNIPIDFKFWQDFRIGGLQTRIRLIKT